MLLKIKTKVFISYHNSKMQRHRINGPALINSFGTEAWFQNGRLHRDNDLPAVIYSGGNKEWWVKGNCIRTGYDT